MCSKNQTVVLFFDRVLKRAHTFFIDVRWGKKKKTKSKQVRGQEAVSKDKKMRNAKHTFDLQQKLKRNQILFHSIHQVYKMVFVQLYDYFCGTIYLLVLTCTIYEICFNLKSQEQLEKKAEIFRETCKQHELQNTEAPSFRNSRFLQMLVQSCIELVCNIPLYDKASFNRKLQSFMLCLHFISMLLFRK